MTKIFCFSNMLEVIFIGKNCLAPVTTVLAVEKYFDFVSLQIFPNPASTYLESVSYPCSSSMFDPRSDPEFQENADLSTETGYFHGFEG